MATLTVGLQHSHLTYGLEWDQDACSDLVNQIGKRLEQIGRIGNAQKTEVLTGAESGGFIRWHDLATLDGSLVSSTYRNNCEGLFSVMVRFEEPDSAIKPVTLEMNQLRKLVRGFGADLEQLRKLTKPWVDKVGLGLESAGFVKSFLVQDATQGSLAASSALERHCFRDTTQPTTPPSPSIVDPYLPAHNTLSTCDEAPLWIDDLFTSGVNQDSQMDWLLYGTETPADTVTPVADPVRASVPQPSFGLASPETISTPGLDEGLSSYPTPFTSCQTPGENTLLVSGPSQVARSRLHPGIASPSPTVISSNGQGHPSYLTPSTLCVQTPGMEEELVLSEHETIMVSQTAEMSELTSAQEKHASMKLIESISKQAIQSLLRSCGASLNDERIRDIFDAEDDLLSKDVEGLLRPLFDHWNKFQLLDLHGLGLPVQWRGIHAAADYLRVLDADKKTRCLNSIAQRIGQVLLYFNYEELCKRPEKYCSHSLSKPKVTDVLNSILDAYPDDPHASEKRQSRRNRITGYHVRRGKWWWRLAGNLGLGILLAGDPMRVMCKSTFTNSQIDLFITFVQKTRPGTIRAFKALEPVVTSLMFGQITSDLHKTIFDWEAGLLRPEEMARVRDDDKVASASQRSENPWKTVDAKKDAMRKMTELLS